jgi:aspartyl-tRNA(Asn)/glutamyl-tRNA(Gln) amidotransferase subunit C
MSKLTGDQVRHIAKLARLTIEDAEVEKFAKELTSILGYVDMLAEVDTSKVQPTAQVTGQTNVFRPDVIRTDATSPDALLATSPLSISDHQIVTPSAHG